MESGRRPPEGMVALLFTDIEGSTRLATELGDDWVEVLADHHRLVGGAIAAEGGFVDGTEGDAFFATFDDAVAAGRAAVAAQRALRAYRWPEAVGELRVRMGLHVGRVQRTELGYVGLDAHLAARVATAANGGQILITEAALQAAGGGIAARDLGPHRLKDFPQPERLYHVMIEPVDERPPPAPRTASVRPTNLPPQTRRLVGREREGALVRELLQDRAGYVVTLTGVGGSGKTRLAVAIGRELLDEFPGGVFLVRLAGVSDVDSILPMIAEVLGITGRGETSLLEALTARFTDQPLLLVLDNFEQLLEGGPLLSDLTQHAADLRMLVTSQVPLRLGSERSVPLGPLTKDDAVALFLERARTVLPRFSAEGKDRVAIEGICTRLEFMPLGIELAAARVGLFAPQELERRLERPLSVLTRNERDAPERQQSLRATIEWSYRLLNLGARTLFARLGACVGAVPLDLVEVVADGGRTSVGILDDLDQLLEFSLVRRQEDRHLPVRFRVPQALRDYALEQLAAAGDEDQVRRRHADYVAEVAHAARLWKFGATLQQRTALLAVADEIRPAVAWTRAHNPVVHVRICAALCGYWAYRGVLSEATHELQRAWESKVGSAAERAWVLTLLAKYAQLQGDEETAVRLSGRLASEWDSVEDRVERALGLRQVSWVLAWEDRFEEAIGIARDALATLRETGDHRLILSGLVRLAQALADAGDAAGSEAVLAEADQLAGGDRAWELTPIHADCALIKGDNALATKLYAESLAWGSANGEFHQALMDLSCLGVGLARLGETEAALETLELLQLEAQRTGRVGDRLSWAWDLEARAWARQVAGSEMAERAAARARALPVASRAERAIELAYEVAQRLNDAGFDNKPAQP